MRSKMTPAQLAFVQNKSARETASFSRRPDFGKPLSPALSPLEARGAREGRGPATLHRPLFSPSLPQRGGEGRGEEASMIPSGAILFLTPPSLRLSPRSKLARRE